MSCLRIRRRMKKAPGRKEDTVGAGSVVRGERSGGEEEFGPRRRIAL
jgi:hypothetical protein